MPTFLLLVLFSAACHSPQPDENDKFSSFGSSELDSVPAITLGKQALLGQLNPARHPDFVRIDTQYTNKPNIYLRKPAYEAFVRMARAARQEGVALRIISATRNFAAQKRIWEAKWKGRRKVNGQVLNIMVPDPKQRALKILEYSSMPGTSRHHWGTDIDLNALTNRYFTKGKGKRVYDWLQAHAAEYGFCQVYTAISEERPGGYHEERWHWSYLPLARQFLRQYNEKISYDDLGGFDGGTVAQEVEAIETYVNGIAPLCRDQEK